MIPALLIEDDVLNRKLMCDILSLRFQVTQATSGAEALERFTHEPPRIVFLDLGLPDVDGLELLKQLKSSAYPTDVPVVVISAHALPHVIRAAMKCGCDEYVTKPVTEDFVQFVDRMEALVRLGSEDRLHSPGECTSSGNGHVPTLLPTPFPASNALQ